MQFVEKYKKLVPTGDTPKEPLKGITIGNFLPDGGKLFRVAVHASGPTKLDIVESENPIFG